MAKGPVLPAVVGPLAPVPREEVTNGYRTGSGIDPYLRLHTEGPANVLPGKHRPGVPIPEELPLREEGIRGNVAARFR